MKMVAEVKNPEHPLHGTSRSSVRITKNKKKRVKNPELVDPLHGISIISLLPRTNMDFDKPTISEQGDMEFIQSYLKSVTMECPSKHLKQAEAILSSTSELQKSEFPCPMLSDDKEKLIPGKGKDQPQERRPGRKRAQFSFKPNASQPALDENLNLNCQGDVKVQAQLELQKYVNDLQYIDGDAHYEELQAEMKKLLPEGKSDLDPDQEYEEKFDELVQENRTFMIEMINLQSNMVNSSSTSHYEAQKKKLEEEHHRKVGTVIQPQISELWNNLQVHKCFKRNSLNDKKHKEHLQFILELKSELTKQQDVNPGSIKEMEPKVKQVLYQRIKCVLKMEKHLSAAGCNKRQKITIAEDERHSENEQPRKPSERSEPSKPSKPSDKETKKIKRCECSRNSNCETVGCICIQQNLFCGIECLCPAICFNREPEEPYTTDIEVLKKTVYCTCARNCRTSSCVCHSNQECCGPGCYCAMPKCKNGKYVHY